jgi:hypothetical protein
MPAPPAPGDRVAGALSTESIVPTGNGDMVLTITGCANALQPTIKDNNKPVVLFMTFIFGWEIIESILLLKIEVARHFSIYSVGGISGYYPIVECIREIFELHVDIATRDSYSDRLCGIGGDVVATGIIDINKTLIGSKIVCGVNMFYFVSATCCRLLLEKQPDTATGGAASERNRVSST